MDIRDIIEGQAEKIERLEQLSIHLMQHMVTSLVHIQSSNMPSSLKSRLVKDGLDSYKNIVSTQPAYRLVQEQLQQQDFLIQQLRHHNKLKLDTTKIKFISSGQPKEA